jgi:sensor c-di-GMP phosphodiesterase-like protein
MQGNINCYVVSRFSSALPVDISNKKRFTTSNDQISFVDLELKDNGMIGIIWQFETYGLMALINIDTLLFDIFPSDWRADSISEIGFDKDHPIGLRDSTILENMVAMKGELTSFATVSSRYPLRAELGVTEQKLIAHARENMAPILFGGSIIGLIFSLLIAQLLSRPTNPLHSIRQGIKNEEFVPYVQPLFDMKNRQIIRGEALMRWVKADGSIVPPTVFIPLAEDSGLIVPMTRSIIQQTLQQIGKDYAQDRSMKISFNITPTDLVSEGFVDELDNLVSASSVAVEQVILEITERQQFEDVNLAIAVIEELKSKGYRVALDDTGTGHNGLSYVQDLQADIMKIDKKFVDFIAIDETGTEIIQMLVDLAKRMKMQTIAEGIETEDQARILTKLGVDQGQGYLVAKPMPTNTFCDELRKQANS